MSIESISVGIDASSASRDALSWAGGLARDAGARVRAIRTWQMPLVGSLPAALGSLPTEDFLITQSEKELERIISEADLSQDVECIVRSGSAGPVLVAESEGSDLLVVGRTGRGRRHGIARLAEVVLGSTARYCVHHATCPVVAVPKGSAWGDNPKVVVGIDGSESSVAALEWAVKNLPESVDLHAVWALPYWSDGLVALDTELYQHAQQASMHELTSCVNAAVNGNATWRARITSRIEAGTPRRVLTDSDAGMQLVVVGDRGRTSVAARVLGSVTDHVVRHAPCPVIVVPS